MATLVTLIDSSAVFRDLFAPNMIARFNSADKTVAFWIVSSKADIRPYVVEVGARDPRKCQELLGILETSTLPETGGAVLVKIEGPASVNVLESTLSMTENRTLVKSRLRGGVSRILLARALKASVGNTVRQLFVMVNIDAVDVCHFRLFYRRDSLNGFVYGPLRCVRIEHDSVLRTIEGWDPPPTEEPDVHFMGSAADDFGRRLRVSIGRPPHPWQIESPN